MIIRKLSTIDPDTIYTAFVEAFQNYVIPLDFNHASTIKRWEESGVDWDLSYGVIQDEVLVAFVLQIPAGEELYNFGTGVIPSHRGKGLIQKIYQVIDRECTGFKMYSLEVIKENIRAIKLYEGLGFKAKRQLISFKGNLTINVNQNTALTYDVYPLNQSDEKSKLTLAHPGMEFSTPVITKNPNRHETHELRDGSELLAYVHFSPETLSLKEFGARHPIQENLDQLFLAMKLNGERLRVMNIDSACKSLIEYFQDRKLEIFVTQYEMKKII